jgi:lysophospholipase L1-like esterase
MYSDTNGRYEKWNGSAWEAIDLGTINFSFNFEKYRQVWGISQPDLVTILLGVNDFNGATFGTDLTNKLESFVTNMDLAIASVKADSSAIKLAVLLPTNAYGAKESGNLFVPYMNAINFVVRKRLIDEYDNREAEGIYLIDTSVAVDDDFGFREFEALPFPEYEPSPGFDTNGRKRWYSADSYHPSEPGYAQLGSKLAAFIQNIR